MESAIWIFGVEKWETVGDRLHFIRLIGWALEIGPSLWFGGWSKGEEF
jgi:hypothetical protein